MSELCREVLLGVSRLLKNANFAYVAIIMGIPRVTLSPTWGKDLVLPIYKVTGGVSTHYSP